MSRPPVIKPLGRTETWIASVLNVAAIICAAASFFVRGSAAANLVTVALSLSVAALWIVKVDRP